MTDHLLLGRITELESRLEFQDETIARLNEALVVQQQRYFQLDKTVKLLVAQIRERLPADDPAQEPPPPHY